jgi:hypothetical protein
MMAAGTTVLGALIAEGALAPGLKSLGRLMCGLGSGTAGLAGFMANRRPWTGLGRPSD